jgi:RND superfamily putative drug exporter
MVGGLAHSGRVIFAAAVMVAASLTFAPFGPLPSKEIEIIVGIAGAAQRCPCG